MTLREFFSPTQEFEEAPAVWRRDQLVVMMADDDEDDYLAVKSALEVAGTRVDLRWVVDGQEAMDYLLRRGKFTAPESSPFPDLILLDLQMPLKDGLETLKEIKGNRRLRKIPVVILTTSRIQENKASGRWLGADSFIIKPHSLDEMVKIMSDLHEHYFGIVRLPDPEKMKDSRTEMNRTYYRGRRRIRLNRAAYSGVVYSGR